MYYTEGNFPLDDKTDCWNDYIYSTSLMIRKKKKSKECSFL